MASSEKGSSNQGWLLPAEGVQRTDVVAEIAVAIRRYTTATYAVPEALRNIVRPGSLVRVPYGTRNREIEGMCVACSEQVWEHTRKRVLSAEPPAEWLTPATIELARWVSDYYFCPPWTTLRALNPLTIRNARERTRVMVQLVSGEVDAAAKLSAGQRALIEAIRQRGAIERRTLGAIDPRFVAAATSLRKRGIVEFMEVSGEQGPRDGMGDAKASAFTTAAEDAYTLTPGQLAALEAIDAASGFRVFVLFGVPGSGKTEVYVRAARRVIEAGRQVVLLIPEIALTTQLVERLARRFPRTVVLHSQLSPNARARTLRAIARGEADVVIGTRSAVFAPALRLGLVIVDEEQESSFKNLASPFYHARDVAIRRAQLETVPIILGSATPAMETWNNANTLAHYQLLRLPERVPGARLPEVRVIERGAVEQDHSADLMTAALRSELRATLAAGQQAVLLHNRRGYASFLQCDSCGLIVRCERCQSRMVFHQSDNAVRCHRCGAKSAAPRTCLDSSCGGRMKRGSGAIQQLEEELKRVVPDARILRLDSDTMRRRQDYIEALSGFERREADVMIGTQMIAKGLDFPAVRLVGVIDADAALMLPDFRAAEHVLQLVVQVIGRAGRREGESLALVQAGSAETPSIAFAMRMDFEGFAREELAVRRQYFYPPYSRLVRIVLADEQPRRAREATVELAVRLREVAGTIDARIRVDDASPCPIGRQRELHRYQVSVRSPRAVSNQKLLRAAWTAKALSPGVKRLVIDVDPIDLM